MSKYLVTPWTIALQAPLSVGFPRQEYWSGLPFPSPGDLPDPRVEPVSYTAGRCFTVEPPGRPPEYSRLLDKSDQYVWKWLSLTRSSSSHTNKSNLNSSLILFFEVLFDSLYKASIILISKLERFTTEKKRTAQISYEYTCKNPQKNTNKPNSAPH